MTQIIIVSTNDFYEYFANMNKHENISDTFIEENIMNYSDNCIFDALDKHLHLMKLKLLCSHSKK